MNWETKHGNWEGELEYAFTRIQLRPVILGKEIKTMTRSLFIRHREPTPLKVSPFIPKIFRIMIPEIKHHYIMKKDGVQVFPGKLVSFSGKSVPPNLDEEYIIFGKMSENDQTLEFMGSEYDGEVYPDISTLEMLR